MVVPFENGRFGEKDEVFSGDRADQSVFSWGTKGTITFRTSLDPTIIELKCFRNVFKNTKNGSTTP